MYPFPLNPSLHYNTLNFFTLPNMPVLCTPFPLHGQVFTLPEVNCRLELAPQFTLPDPTHIAGFILM